MDGMTVVNDESDEATASSSMPLIKHKVAFKDARRKLRFVNIFMLYTRTDVLFSMNRARTNLMQETSQLEISKNSMDTVRDTLEDVLRKT